MKHGNNKRNKKSKIYATWERVIQRCNNPNHRQYKDYGGRGITVRDRWLKFENFLKDIGDIPKGKSIDRINNNGNYEPNNWKFATPKEQNRNKRNNIYLTFNNKT